MQLRRGMKRQAPSNPMVRNARQEVPSIEPGEVSSISVVWALPFPDDNYNVYAQLVSCCIGGVVVVDQVKNITAAGCVVDIKNISGTLFNNSEIRLHVSGIHG